MSLAIFLVPAAAALAPLLAAVVGRAVAVPLVVFEILLGMLIGPSGLNWLQDGDLLEGFSHLGLAMLFFMAGNEIDVRALEGRTGRKALGGWGVSIVLAIAAAALIGDGVASIAIIAIALTGTALGTITPILRDAGLTKGPVGAAISGAGAVGEFGPLIAITIFLSGRQPVVALAVLAFFAAVAAFAFYNASRKERPWLIDMVHNTLNTSGQFAVRLVVFVMTALIALALALEVDYLLAAFTAGLLVKVMLRGVDRQQQEVISTKLDGLAYGFLVPIFFVTTGVTFPLDSLLAKPQVLMLVPILAVIMLVVRGGPAFFALDRGATLSDRRTVSLFAATTLPLVIAVTSIGTRSQVIDDAMAAAMVGAGMLTVLLFPLLALLGRKRPATAPADEDETGSGSGRMDSAGTQ